MLKVPKDQLPDEKLVIVESWKLQIHSQTSLNHFSIVAICQPCLDLNSHLVPHRGNFGNVLCQQTSNLPPDKI